MYRGIPAPKANVSKSDAVVALGTVAPADGGLRPPMGLGCTATLIRVTDGNGLYALTAGHCLVQIGDGLVVPVAQADTIVDVRYVGTIKNVSSRLNIDQKRSNDIALLYAERANVSESLVEAELVFSHAQNGTYALGGYGYTTCEHTKTLELLDRATHQFDPEQCAFQDSLSSSAVEATSSVQQVLDFKGAMGAGELRFAFLPLQGTKEGYKDDVLIADELQFLVWPYFNRSAAIRKGDSGGPCFDPLGRLAGVNSGRIVDARGASGLDAHYCSSIRPHCEWICSAAEEWEGEACLLDCATPLYLPFPSVPPSLPPFRPPACPPSYPALASQSPAEQEKMETQTNRNAFPPPPPSPPFPPPRIPHFAWELRPNLPFKSPPSPPPPSPPPRPASPRPTPPSPPPAACPMHPPRQPPPSPPPLPATPRPTPPFPTPVGFPVHPPRHPPPCPPRERSLRERALKWTGLGFSIVPLLAWPFQRSAFFQEPPFKRSPSRGLPFLNI